MWSPRMKRTRQAGRRALILILGALLSCGAHAAAAADARKGLEIARVVCSGCHAVERGNLRSIDRNAPSFSVLANWPAMSEMALRAALQRPHRLMPNIVLAREDRDDIVAYITGLKED
jgi:mono/diheme cytochrome c family protein